MTESSMQLASLSRQHGKPLVQSCAIQRLENVDAALDKLIQQVAMPGLKGSACNCLLATRDYSLYLIEAPKVLAEELRPTARWKVKDMLDMPAHEAVIDVFPLPDDAFIGRPRMIYVVAAARSRIEYLVELLGRVGLKLNSIDISELALHNITRQCAEDANGLAVLSLRDGSGFLSLSRDGKLYITRRINTRVDRGALQGPDVVDLLERLVLASAAELVSPTGGVPGVMQNANDFIAVPDGGVITFFNDNLRYLEVGTVRFWGQVDGGSYLGESFTAKPGDRHGPFHPMGLPSRFSVGGSLLHQWLARFYLYGSAL